MTALSELAQKFELTFTPTRPGIATCMARNSEGNDSSQAQVLIADLDKPLQTWGVDEDPIAAGDPLTLTCGALVYTYAADLQWYLNGVPVISTDGNTRLDMFLYHGYIFMFIPTSYSFQQMYKSPHTILSIRTVAI